MVPQTIGETNPPKFPIIFMVPERVPLTVEVTCVVNVTDWPLTDGFRLEAIVVLVAAGLTV